MLTSGRLFCTSEQVYRWLVEAYPKRFRSEYGQEMVQVFRDRCREELHRGRLSGVVRLWGHTVLDLAVTVTIEHLKRKGESMNTADRDLRWDVRYGFEMFLKHSLVVLKYSAWASGVLIGLLLVAFLGGLLVSTLAVWHKEKPLNEAWKTTNGYPPEEFAQRMISRFPKRGMDNTASKLEVLTTKLGILDPMPFRVYEGERRKPDLLKSLDVPPYLDTQLRKSSDDLDEVPGDIRAYLADHRADLDALYNLVIQSGPPKWEMDISRWVNAPVPGLHYHRQLHGVIALDILAKTQVGQNQEALRAFEASWKINQGLLDRPELLSQLVGYSVLNRQAGVLRKMKEVPSEWQTRIMARDFQSQFLEAIGLDVVAMSRYLNDTNNDVSFLGLDGNILNSPIGRPFRRIMGVQALEVGNQILSELKASDFCSFDPDAAREQLDASHSRRNPGANLTNNLRAWKTLTRSLVNLELTRQTLQVKTAHASQGGGSLRRLTDSPSKFCRDGRWVAQSKADGTVLIACTRLPEWLGRENTRFDLPLTYALRPNAMK